MKPYLKLTCIIHIIFLFICNQNAFAQANTCVTAEILCSLNELDGFTGTMPTSNATGEFPPGGLCPGGGTNQNITWFAFIAGSTDASFNLITSNCTIPGGGTPAIQYGVYTDCNFTDDVICISGAVPAGTIPINLTGLVPGDDYFFFIDGDLGTYCDFEIEVLSGGNTVDLPEPTGIDCISADCMLNGYNCKAPVTLTFEVQGIDLSIDYIWTVSPEPPVGNTVVGSNQNTFTFDDPGVYMICVKAENGCSETGEVCYELTIDPPEAGSLMASPMDLCPGSISTISVTGYNTEMNLTQTLIAVDPGGIVVEVVNGDELDLTYNDCGTLTVYSYNYNSDNSPAPPIIGAFFSIPDCINSCCDIESIQINFEDNESPFFIDPPEDIDVMCEQDVPPMEELTWEDNCTGTGTVIGTEINNIFLCQSGVISRTWIYFDDCFNSVTHTQLINVAFDVDAPTANDVSIELCLSENTSDTISLQSLNQLVNPNSNFDFKYYPTLFDVEDGTNELDDEYIIESETTIYVTVSNECNCQEIGEINFIFEDAPIFDLQVDQISCLDSMDGKIELSNISPVGTLFGFNSFDYTNSLIYDSLKTGTYIINSISPDGCIGSDTIVLAEGQELILEELTIECNTNSTTTDSSDDFFEISFVLSNTVIDTNRVVINSSVLGEIDTFSYGSISFTLPAGAEQTITIVDVVSGCMTTFDTGILTPCSDNCVINIDSLSVTCNDNGTLGIVDDDWYEINIAASIINSMSSSYLLFIDGEEVSTNNFNEIVSFSIEADAQGHEILLVDVLDTTCFTLIETIPLVPCSGECNLSVDLQTAVCNNQGTTLNADDDVFTIEANVKISSGSGQWTIVGEGITGSSGDVTNLGPYLISEGIRTLIIQDANIPSCVDTIMLTPPNTCSMCTGTVEAGDDWLLTCSIDEAELSATTSPDVQGVWTGPNGFQFNGNSVTVDIPGKYIFTANFGQDCIITDSLWIEASNDIPQITIPTPQSITCLIDTVTLIPTFTGGSGFFEFRWLDSNMNLLANTMTLEVTSPGDYFLEIHDISSDCTSPAMLFKVEDESTDLSLQIQANPGLIIGCTIEEIELNVTEIPNASYAWYIENELVMNMGSQLVINEAANIKVIVTHNVTGCTGEDDITIEDDIRYPLISILPIDTINCQLDSVTIDGSGSQSGSSILYTWLDSESTILVEGDSTINVSEPGTYFLQLIDTINGCINWDTVEVISNIEYPAIEVPETIFIPCDEDNIQIIATGFNPEFNINWSTTNGNISSMTNGAFVTVESEGTYVAEVTNLENFCASSDTTLVNTFDQIVDLEFNTEEEACAGSKNGSITITDIQGGEPPFVFNVSGNIYSTSTIQNLSAGSYNILVTDQNGCSFQSTITIEESENINIDLVPEIEVFQNEVATIIAQLNIDNEDIESISWTPSIGLSCDSCLITQVTVGKTNKTYTIQVTDKYGCMAEAIINVKSKQKLIITKPNVLNVNGNGSNNSNFTIYSNKDAIISELGIYDRWGNLIFEAKGIPTNQPSLGWNGMFNGKKAISGVYVYSYKLITTEGENISGYGDLTVF